MTNAANSKVARLIAAIAPCLGFSAGVSPQDAAAPAPVPATPPAQVTWKYAPPDTSFHDVMLADGTVYALDRQGNTHALDAVSGEPRWVSNGDGAAGSTSGMGFGKHDDFAAVLVGCDKGILALNPATGATLWHASIPRGAAGPACAQGVVVAGSGDGHVYGFDLRHGEEQWKHDYMADRPADPDGLAGDQARLGNQAARPRDAAAEGHLVVLSVFDQCRTLALDASTGERLWTLQTKGWIYSRPAIGPRNVFVGSQDDHLYAVDKETGKIVWQVETGGRNEATAAPTERFAYFGSCDAHLYAVDQVVGRVVWKYKIESLERYGGPIYGQPVVTEDTIYLASLHGKLYAVDRENGTLRWKMQVLADSDINSDLVTDGTRFFVTTRKDEEAGESAVVAITPR